MNAIWFVINAIIFVTPIAVLCLVLIRFLPIKPVLRSNKDIVLSVNILLLSNAFLYLAAVIAQFFITYYTGGEYEQYTFTNRFFGPYWFSPFILVGIRFILLPQIFWVKKFRQRLRYSIIVILIWVVIQVLLYAYLYWIGAGFTMRYTLQPISEVGLYILVLGITYWLFRRNSAHSNGGVGR